MIKSDASERRGEVYALLLSLLEGFFPIFTLVTVAAYGAFYAYFYTIVIATIVLLFLVWKKGLLAALSSSGARKDLLLTSLFITSLFLLIFVALRYTNPGNVAVILVLQLFFSYLYFNVIGGDRLSLLHSLGAAMMGVGAAIILFPEDWQLNVGDLYALAAAAIAPVANYYQQRARRQVASIVVLSFRNLVALPFILLLAFLFEPWANPFSNMMALGYLLINAGLIFVLAKILWVESLHYISITKLSAMASFIPVFTMLFAWWLLGEMPGLRQIAGAVPVMAGAYLMTRRPVVVSPDRQVS